MTEVPLTPIRRRPRRHRQYGALFRVLAWLYAIALLGALCSLLFITEPMTRIHVWFAVGNSLIAALLILSLRVAWRAKTSAKRNAAIGCSLAVVSGWCFAYTVLPFLALAAMHEGGGFRAFFQAGSSIPFEAERWRENDTPWWSRPIRYRMGEDLVYRRILIGMTPGEVEQLLGHWDNTTYPFSDCDMVYVLKPTFVDHLWVAITLDDSGRVASARIRED